FAWSSVLFSVMDPSSAYPRGVPTRSSDRKIAHAFAPHQDGCMASGKRTEAGAPRKTYLVTITRFDAPTRQCMRSGGLSKRKRRRNGGGREKWMGLPYQSQSRTFSLSAQRRLPI